MKQDEGDRTSDVDDKVFKDKSEPVFFNGWPERNKLYFSRESECSSPTTSSSSAVSQKSGKHRLHREDLHIEVPKPEIVLFQNNSVPVIVSVIVHPREFYVHIISEKTSQLDDLAEQLNSYYSNSHGMVLVKSLRIGSYCACQYSVDCCWYRVVILEITEYPKSKKLPEKDTLVQYIDYGNKEYVCSKYLRPLPAFLACMPAFAIHCALVHLQPADQESDSSGNEWSEKTITRFKELTGFEKCFTAQFLPPLNRSKQEIILWEKDETSINDILIQEGLAVNTSSTNERREFEEKNSELGSIDCSVAGWNPMADDYLNDQNLYEVDLDDPEIAFVGYKAKDEKYTCKFFSRGERCYRGERCPYRHIRTEGVSTLDKEVEFSCDLNIDLPQVGTFVLAQVTAVFNPTHFYTTFPYGTLPVDDVRIFSHPEAENLDKFIKSMSIYYGSAKLKKSVTHHALGKIVAARYQFDDQWYRAKIHDINSTESKVFYVDFGNCEWVHNSDLAELDQKFLDYPFQAVECKLANVQMRGEKDSELNKISWELFRTLTEDKIILAQIVGFVESILLVKLHSVTETTDISINDELIVRGLAVPDTATTPDTSLN